MAAIQMTNMWVAALKPLLLLAASKLLITKC